MIFFQTLKESVNTMDHKSLFYWVGVKHPVFYIESI